MKTNFEVPPEFKQTLHLEAWTGDYGVKMLRFPDGSSQPLLGNDLLAKLLAEGYDLVVSGE